MPRVPFRCLRCGQRPRCPGLHRQLRAPRRQYHRLYLIDFPMLGKWLELLKEMVPNIRRAALMFNPNTARYYPVYLREFRALPHEMSYGPDSQDIFRRSASYVDRILKGENPAELPAQAPTKFEFVINLKAAKAIGVSVPPCSRAPTTRPGPCAF